MSRNLTTDDVSALIKLISTDRLENFRSLTRDDIDAIELHQATMRLGTSLQAVTSSIEIVLRNAVCVCLVSFFRDSNWIELTTVEFNWRKSEHQQVTKACRDARRAMYSKLDAEAKRRLDDIAFADGRPDDLTHEDVARRRQQTIDVPIGQIVSHLTFRFWKRLFSDEYEATLWKPALKNIFPNKRIKRAEVAAHLETLYQIRNRLAHHEPVYGKRLDEAVEAIDFIRTNLGSKVPSVVSPAAKFILPHREDLAGAMAVFDISSNRLIVG